MSKAPDNASGAAAELQPAAWLNHTGHGTYVKASLSTAEAAAEWCGRPAWKSLVFQADASRLLAQKDVELQRAQAQCDHLREALRRISLIEIDRDYHDPDEMIERGLSAVGQARAALNP
jgi:hypothetical protein